MYKEVLNTVLEEFRVKQRTEKFRMYKANQLSKERTRCFICDMFRHYARELRVEAKSLSSERQCLKRGLRQGVGGKKEVTFKGDLVKIDYKKKKVKKRIKMLISCKN
ncbi:hypothetical protein NGRA_1563 [Nosema granulosis]|uniref:Uncharacterized protein n=1 Tax=Nosema granulosis TaxID=83296 RepID=A0A9P6GZ95_9MICR|nr:hypothetical protein NGRA_1563 [Nosema granulosis]